MELYPLNLVQLPLSLVDQRLIRGGQLDRLADAGVAVHARSLFLQGAMLIPPDRLPPHLSRLQPTLQEVIRRASQIGLSPIEAALRFVAGLPQVAAVVCGVDTAKQFSELAAALKVLVPALAQEDVEACSVGDTSLVDPTKWRRT